MGLGATPEVIAVHDALEAAALRDPGDLHPVARGEDGHRDLVARFGRFALARQHEALDEVGRELEPRPFHVTRERLARALRLALTEAELDLRAWPRRPADRASSARRSSASVNRECRSTACASSTRTARGSSCRCAGCGARSRAAAWSAGGSGPRLAPRSSQRCARYRPPPGRSARGRTLSAECESCPPWDPRYFKILVTTPAPTVRPPSRIAKRSCSSIAIGVISSIVIFVLSPGITISTPAGSSTVPVTSVVRK